MKLTLLMALTLDGRIAKDANHFADWTEQADKKLFVEVTKKSGVMIMGRTTFETLPGKLPGRLHVILSRSAGEWDEREENLVFTSLPPLQILKKLESLGFQETTLTGGTQINSLFAKAQLIDELIITFSPIIFGSGLSLFDDSIAMDLELKSLDKLGENSMVARYRVR